MFGLFKRNPLRKLEAQYAKKLEEARDQQRNGDVVAAAQLTADAEDILAKIERLESGKKQDEA